MGGKLVMTKAKASTKESTLLLVWIVLSVVAVGALGVLAGAWNLGNPSKDKLWYEVAKTSRRPR